MQARRELARGRKRRSSGGVGGQRGGGGGLWLAGAARSWAAQAARPEPRASRPPRAREPGCERRGAAGRGRRRPCALLQLRAQRAGRGARRRRRGRSRPRRQQRRENRCATSRRRSRATPSSPEFELTCGGEQHDPDWPVTDKHAGRNRGHLLAQLAPTRISARLDNAGRPPAPSSLQPTSAEPSRVCTPATVVGAHGGAQCGNSVMHQPVPRYTPCWRAPTTRPCFREMGETLNWRLRRVPCAGRHRCQPERIRASIRTGTDVTRANGVKFWASATASRPFAAPSTARSSTCCVAHDNFWSTPNNYFSVLARQCSMLSDTNNRMAKRADTRSR